MGDLDHLAGKDAVTKRLSAMRDSITTLTAERDALRAQVDVMKAENANIREAARKLSNEVGGLKAFEADLRAIIGNTNWYVLMLRLEEADAALR